MTETIDPDTQEERDEAAKRIRVARVHLERSHGFVHPVITIGTARRFERNDLESYEPAGDYKSCRVAGPKGKKHPIPMALLDHFRIEAQGNVDEPGELYGQRYCYEAHRVEPYDLRGYAKVFSYVERALAKVERVAGRATGFAQFALRILVALGVERVYVEKGLGRGSGDGRYTCHESQDLGHGLQYAERRLWTEEEHQRKAQPQQVSA
jgi:hypothetical protein